MFGPHPKFFSSMPRPDDGQMINHDDGTFFLRFSELPLHLDKPSDALLQDSGICKHAAIAEHDVALILFRRS
jgi:hypothetical protein